MCPLEGPGSRRLFPVFTSFLYNTLFSQSRDKEGSEVDNRCHRTRVPLRITRVRYPALLQQPPPKHFHINNQAIFLHANPSKRAEANLRVWAASFFQVCLIPWQTFVPLYMEHKAPALSALIDQRPAEEEERSIPYQ